MLRFACIKCGAPLTANESQSGQKRSCLKCFRTNIIPTVTASGIDIEDWLSEHASHSNSGTPKGIFREEILGPGTFQYRVSGTSFHQEAIVSVFDPPVQWESVEIPMACLLRSEWDSSFDENAISAFSQGVNLGYLSRDNAYELSSWLRRNGYTGIESVVQARLIGGAFGVSDYGLTRHNFGLRVDAFMPSDMDERISEDCEYFSFRVRSMSTVGVNDHGCFCLTTEDDFLPLCVGDRVKFWHPPGDLDSIFIYARGSLSGDGRLGFVPQYAHDAVVANYFHDKTLEAYIHSVDEADCVVECRQCRHRQ